MEKGAGLEQKETVANMIVNMVNGKYLYLYQLIMVTINKYKLL